MENKTGIFDISNNFSEKNVDRNKVVKNYILNNFKTFFKQYMTFIYSYLEKKQLKWSWHLDLMGYQVLQVLQGKSKRVIWNLPPGSCKTTISIALDSLYVAFFPQTRMVLVAGSEGVRDKYIIYMKSILSSSFYRNLFRGVEIDEQKSNTQQKFFIKGGIGFFKVYSSGEKITGEDIDYLCLDDVIDYGKFQQQGFEYVEKINQKVSASLGGRLRQQAGEAVMVVIMQRICKDDTTEYLIKNWKSTKWLHLSIPAKCDLKDDIYEGKYGKIYEMYGKKIFFEYGKIFTTYYDEDWYNKEKERFCGLEKDFYFQYQQRDNDSLNKIFSLGKIKMYKEIPQNKTFIKLLSIDCASGIEGRDRNAIGIFFMDDENNLYLKEIFFNHMQYEELLSFVRDLIKIYAIDITIVEWKTQGISLMQDLENDRYGQKITESQRREFSKNLFNPLVAIVPTKNKEFRACESNTYIDLGKLYFPEKLDNITDFKFEENVNAFEYLLTELNNFPNYTHDDGVDMLTQLLSYVKSRFFIQREVKAEDIMSFL